MAAPSYAMDVLGVDAAIDAVESTREAVGGSDAWVVGVGAEYAAYVEFGTSTNPAQPYLFPATRHVMRTRLDEFGRRANTVEELVEMLALAIEAEAKRRAPVDTGNLRASIRAYPV